MATPSPSSRWALTEKSSQVAPTLQVSRSGAGKWPPETNAPSIARTGQNKSSMPSESATRRSQVLCSMMHGTHQAPSG